MIKAPQHTEFRMTVSTWAILACAGFLLWVAFQESLAKMYQVWVQREEYSHCFLIPIVVLFLIWQRHTELQRIQFTGSWTGLAVIAMGGLLHVFGQFSSIFTLSQCGFVLCLTGLALSFLGWTAFKRILVPCLILIFMVPLPDFILRNLSAEMQLISSRLGVLFMEQFGVTVFLEGNVIHLANYSLQVAEACDGLRYLFPLMTLGFLMAYFFQVVLWKRLLLFLSSIPITLVMNSLRVGTIGIMVEHWGVRMAEGFLHDFQGWAIFMLSAGVMLVEMTLLVRIGRERKPWRQVFGIEFPERNAPGLRWIYRPIPSSVFGSLAFIVVLTLVTLLIPGRAEAIPRRDTFVEFPLTIGNWEGRKEGLEQMYLEALKLDDYLLADFTRENSPPINLYIAWYDSQRAGRSTHSPRSCLPGGGWQITNFSQIDVPGVSVGGGPIRVNRVLIQLGNQKQLVYYWFQQRGRVVTNEYLVKWYLFWDSLTRNRTDGALVRLSVPFNHSQSERAAEQELDDFLREAAPRLDAFVPG